MGFYDCGGLLVLQYAWLVSQVISEFDLLTHCENPLYGHRGLDLDSRRVFRASRTFLLVQFLYLGFFFFLPEGIVALPVENV